ncbi:MAG TPA: PqqD family protein [Thermoanaerobaculia bacterium]|nr:PqqD family protein [Thermoanaerobaculia bacterium]
MALNLPFARGRQDSKEESIGIEPHVRSMIDGDGAVLLDLKAGRYYSLNGVAAGIWSRVEKGLTLPQILDELRQTYQVPAERLQADLAAFVRAMEEKGLLRVHA